jgi:chromosome partitioning protein
MIDGRTAGELDPKGKSAAEVAQLWRYLADRLDKEVRYGTTVAA